MKIDLSLAPIEKDSAPRSPAGTDGDRHAMGDAFGRAVRDAEGKRSANSNGKPEKTGEPRGPDEVEGRDGADTGADSSGDTEAGSEAENGAIPLQTLLGALASLTKQAAAAQSARQKASEDGKEQGDAVSMLEVKVGPIEAPEAAAGKDKSAMKLDVLRMETHFEPHQDGMVLVEGAATSKAGGADAKAKPTDADKTALASTLADVSRLASPDAKTGASEGAAASSKDDASVPMRFDEALARLGRGGGERSGGENNRDGSAAAQSALAELASRRSTVRAADAVSGAGSVDLGASAGTSPYNLAGQVAGPIMEALGDTGQSSAQSAPASSDAHLRMRAGGGALKTLTIQLHPEHLGTVDVSMRLNEGRLTLELAASRSDTASMLLDDQASLRKLLEHAGFSLDDAAISVVTRDSGQVRTGDTASNVSQQRDAGGSAPGDGRSDARGQSSGSDERPARRQPPTRGVDDAGPAPTRSGSTYL